MSLVLCQWGPSKTLVLLLDLLVCHFVTHRHYQDDDDDDDDVYDDISAVMVMWISLRELVPTFKELMCQLGHSFL